MISCPPVGFSELGPEDVRTICRGRRAGGGGGGDVK